MWTNIKVFIIITLLILFTILVMQNTEPTVVRFFNIRITTPTVLLLLTTLLGGFLMGFFSAKLGNRKKRKAERATPITPPAPVPTAPPEKTPTP